MSVVLHGSALVLALLAVPAVAVLAWGLAGGDGTPETPLLAMCGALLGWGSVYNAAVTFASLFDDLHVRWWLMWLAPLGGLLGVVMASGELAAERPVARAAVFAGPLAVAAAPLLLLAAGAAHP